MLWSYKLIKLWPVYMRPLTVLVLGKTYISIFSYLFYLYIFMKIYCVHGNSGSDYWLVTKRAEKNSYTIQLMHFITLLSMYVINCNILV